MLIELHIQADRDKVRLTFPRFDKTMVVKNCVAYQVSKDGVRSIVALGEDANDLLQETPLHLQSELAVLNYAHPFAIDQFQPEFIEAMIKYYGAKFLGIEQALHWLRWYFIDRFFLELSIADYERLPLTQRQEFEYGLKISLRPKVREMTVNGGSVLTPEFIQAKHRFERQRAIADWSLWVGRMLGTVGLLWLTVRALSDFPVSSELWWVWGVLFIGGVGAVLGDWLALTIWGVMMSRILPRSMLRMLVAQSNIAKIEKMWLERLLNDPAWK